MKTKYIVKVAILAAVATVLMFIETPLPFLPPFLKLDISEIPVLIGVFALNPLAGLFIELIKNLIHLLSTQTGGVGELANFLIGISLTIPAGIIYHYKKTFRSALFGLAVSSILMAIVGTVLNLYLLVPFYARVGLPMEAIIEACRSVNPNIADLKTLVLYGIMPFNLVKAIFVSALTLISYKKISRLLKK